MENLIDYQNARIEALEKRNNYLESELLKAKELFNAMVLDAENIELINPEIVK